MKIYLEFSNKGYNTINSQRLEIYLSALNLIMINPIFGIGAASFSSIYFLETNLWKGHSHNLFFELAISYGLPATLIFFIEASIPTTSAPNLLIGSDNKPPPQPTSKIFTFSKGFSLIEMSLMALQ